MATLLSLPPETLVQIFKFVEPNDLKSLRNTCKCTESAATTLFAEQFLTDRRHVMTLESIEALQEIVYHHYFGRFVRTIAFNCVRSIPSQALKDEDNPDSVPPFQFGPEETVHDIEVKKIKVGKIIKRIRDNHRKISIGVFFENIYDEQLCHGLVDGIRYCTIDWSTGYRPSYSLVHLRNTLKTLLRMCNLLCCHVQRVEVDL